MTCIKCGFNTDQLNEDEVCPECQENEHDKVLQCTSCGVRGNWLMDEDDPTRNRLWECEECGQIVCEGCIIRAMKERDNEFTIPVSHMDKILCPECIEMGVDSKK